MKQTGHNSNTGAILAFIGLGGGIFILLALWLCLVYPLTLFMLVTTNFAPQPGIQVKLLPPVGWEPQKVWDELDLWEKTRLIIRVINPEETEKYGIMILNDEIVDFQDLPGKFQNVPNESKRMLIIQSKRDVLHEQIVMIADVAKRTGVREIAYLPLTYAPRNRPKG